MVVDAGALDGTRLLYIESECPLVFCGIMVRGITITIIHNTHF